MKYEIGVLDVVELTALRHINLTKQNGLTEFYEVKSFPFPNGVRVVSENTMDYILSILKKERDTTIMELLKLVKLKAQNTKLKNKNERLAKELAEIKKNLKELETMYGKYVSPFTVIEELYRGLSLSYMILNKRRDFKIKLSEKQFDYWVGIFISLKIIRRIDKSNLQSILDYKMASDRLYENDYYWDDNRAEKAVVPNTEDTGEADKMKLEHGYTSSTETAGSAGTTLTEEEEKEITKELKEELSNKIKGKS